jgi:hypothetical protein
MNKILITKDVAYRAKKGGGTIASIKEINELAAGAIAFFTPDGSIILVPADQTAPVVAAAAALLRDVKTVSIATGREVGANLVSMIPRRGVNEVNRQNYKAAVKPIIRVGGTTAALALPFAASGDASIRVYDSSYTTRFNTAFANASEYKRVGETNEALLDRLIAQLNANTSLEVTVAKLGAGTANLGFTVTPKEDNITIEVAVGGMFEYASIVQTTQGNYSINSGADILQIEKDFSSDEGNGNYQEFTNEWYSRNMEANVSANYDVVNIMWEGMHDTPTSSHVVMHNRVALAFITSAATFGANAVNNILSLIFTNVTTANSGVEGATDDGTDEDGIAGN